MSLTMEVLLLLLILQLSISLPLQDAHNSKGLLVNLTCFDVKNGYTSEESTGFQLPTENVQTSKILNSNIVDGDVLSLVVNGQAASRGQFAYQVGIINMVNNMYGFLGCGGSLISSTYVLSAAHCFKEGTGIINWLVVLGGLDLSKSYEEGRATLMFQRSNIKIHEKYNPATNLNDIVLIQLPRSVQQTGYIKAVQLPSRIEANLLNTFMGSKCVISGWGRTSDISESTSPYLRYGYMTVMSQWSCIQSYKSAKYTITEGQICATVGSSLSNSCNGDSGGPLVLPSFNLRQIQIGVVSLGAEKCEQGFPTAFTRIGSYLNWIAANSDVKVV